MSRATDQNDFTRIRNQIVKQLRFIIEVNIGFDAFDQVQQFQSSEKPCSEKRKKSESGWLPFSELPLVDERKIFQLEIVIPCRALDRRIEDRIRRKLVSQGQRKCVCSLLRHRDQPIQTFTSQMIKTDIHLPLHLHILRRPYKQLTNKRCNQRFPANDRDKKMTYTRFIQKAFQIWIRRKFITRQCA